MGNGADPKRAIFQPVELRERIPTDRIEASPVRGRRSQSWRFGDQFGFRLEGVQEIHCGDGAKVLKAEGRGVREFFFSL
mgnify:CR=1 FL=1